MSNAEGAMTIEDQIKQAIESQVPDSTAEVGGDGRHFEIQVKQRIVYAALSELMAGSNAPVHAIARLDTLVPE